MAKQFPKLSPTDNYNKIYIDSQVIVAINILVQIKGTVRQSTVSECTREFGEKSE